MSWHLPTKMMTTALLLSVVASARGTIYTEVFSPGALVPEGDPVGIVSAGNVADIPAGQTMVSLRVALNISGGYNGDFVADLISPSGTVVALLNNPGVGINGFGAGGAGMNIWLQAGTTDHGNIDAETGGGILSGSYNPSAGNFSALAGESVSGTWNLLFADMGSGGGAPTVNSWSLEITSVPEPTPIALACFLTFVVCRVGILRMRSGKIF